jgi:hypothetical protein
LNILTTSSPKTLRWLEIIKSKAIIEIHSIQYNESEKWASFKSPETKRSVAYLQPLKNQIRLFTELPLTFDSRLELTPASKRWAKAYPSVFKIRCEDDIEKAIYFIINSYRFDLTKKSLTENQVDA